MFENPQWVPALLAALVVLQLLVLAVLLRLSGRVARLFRLIASPVPPANIISATQAARPPSERSW